MKNVVRLDEPMSVELRCAECGATERKDWKQCRRLRGLICPEHCAECEYYDDGSSIPVCRWEAAEYDGIAELDQGQGLRLCSCRLWFERELGRYIIAVGRQADKYIVVAGDRPEEAVERFLREADGFAVVAAHVARRGTKTRSLDIDLLESRGVALRAIWNDMWELRRISMADDECRREIYLDPLEAWESFREALRIRLQTAIEQTAIEAKEA